MICEVFILASIDLVGVGEMSGPESRSPVS
jgi:hypothetical protein